MADQFRRFPATTVLLALNVLVFLAMVLVGHVSLKEPTIPQLIRWGGNSGELVILHNQWWRIVSSAFVHIGAAHLIMNMWALWVLGTLAEAVLGTYLYVGIYIVSAIAGSLASLHWNPLVMGAGASGALMGIVGAVVSVLKFARLPLPREVLRKTLRSLVQGILLTLAIGVLPRIDNAAHVGGLVCGLVIGLVLSWTRRADYTLQRPLRHVALLLPFGLMVPFALAVRAHGEPLVHLQQAIDSVNNGRYAEGEREARIALRRLPNRPAVIEVLSTALFAQNNTVEARRYLQQLLTQDPRSDFAANSLAMIDIKESNFIGARDLLMKWLPLQPRNATGQFYLGQALQALDQDDEAAVHYRQALQIAPTMLEAQFGLARIYEKHQHPKEAAALYQQTLKAQPKNMEALRGLARAYLAAGLTKEADQVIGQIRSLEEGGEKLGSKEPEKSK